MNKLTSLLITLISLTSLNASAGIVKQAKAECTLYKVDDAITKDNKTVNTVSTKRVYGMYIDDMKINFDERVASFKLKQAVVLGFDSEFTGKRVFIHENHPQFDEFTNLLQKDLAFIEEICLEKSGEVIEFKMLEAK